jgi:hypothetical protein
MSNFFREMMTQIPVPGTKEGDLEVLSRIMNDVEFLYERPYRLRDKDYTLKNKDFLPFLRALRTLAKEHKALSEEVIALSTRIIGEQHK